MPNLIFKKSGILSGRRPTLTKRCDACRSTGFGIVPIHHLRIINLSLFFLFLGVILVGLVLISKKKKALRPKYTDAGSVSIGRMVNVFSRRLSTDAAVVWRRDFLIFIKLFKDPLLILFSFYLEFQDFVALWV